MPPTIPNDRPWPKIDNIVECANLRLLLERNASAVVSEKLDGSNLAVSSDGVVASRRFVILNEAADEEDFFTTKFVGETLENLLPVLDSAKRISKYFNERIASSDGDFTVTLFGEFMSEGTATGKRDKFEYSKRGFLPGHFYAFGVGIFNCGDSICDRLNEIGFRVKLKQTSDGSNTPYVIINLNNELHEIFSDFGIFSVPFKEMSLSEAFSTYGPFLSSSANVMEGVVISVENSGCYKWKGLDEVYSPSRLKELDSRRLELTGTKFENSVGGQLQEVADAALQRVAEEKRLQSRIVQAFESAQTKYRTLQDRIEETEEKRLWESVLKDQIQIISKEMMEDADSDEEEYFRTESKQFAMKKLRNEFNKIVKNLRNRQ